MSIRVALNRMIRLILAPPVVVAAAVLQRKEGRNHAGNKPLYTTYQSINF